MPWAADYWDAWEHLVVPQPSNLLDYDARQRPAGACSDPNRVWDVDYSDPAAGLELHFRYTALMEPYDINDPAQDPMAADRDMDLTWGHAYAGHFDQTGHYEGEIALRGGTHADRLRDHHGPQLGRPGRTADVPAVAGCTRTSRPGPGGARHCSTSPPTAGRTRRRR